MCITCPKYLLATLHCPMKIKAFWIPQVPLLACPVLLIFPYSIAHFHSQFQLVIPVFLNLICIHLEIDEMPALTISFLFLSDGQLPAPVSLLYPVVISLAK